MIDPVHLILINPDMWIRFSIRVEMQDHTGFVLKTIKTIYLKFLFILC